MCNTWVWTHLEKNRLFDVLQKKGPVWTGPRLTLLIKATKFQFLLLHTGRSIKTCTKVNQCSHAYILTAHPPAGHFEVILAVALWMKQILSTGLKQCTHRLLWLKHQVHITYNRQVCHWTEMDSLKNWRGKKKATGSLARRLETKCVKEWKSCIHPWVIKTIPHAGLTSAATVGHAVFAKSHGLHMNF